MSLVDSASQFRERLRLRRIKIALREWRTMSDVKRQGILDALLSKELLGKVDTCDHSQPITININNSTVNILCRSPGEPVQVKG